MTIRYRVLLIVTAALLALLPMQYFALRAVFVRSLTAREAAAVTQQTAQARSALEDEFTNLNAIAADYAAWDKTYQYVLHPDPEFTSSDLADESFRRLRLDAVIIVDDAGRLVMVRMLPQGPAALPGQLAPHLRPGGSLTHFTSTDDSHTGLVDTPDGPVAIAVRPVIRSDGSGPIRGAILMARRMDLAEVARIAEVTRLSLRLDHLSSGAAPGTGVVVTPQSRDRIQGSTVVGDVYDRPAWEIRVETGRPLQRQGERLLTYFVASLVGSVVLVATITLLLLDGLVLRRLSLVSRAVRGIAETGALATRVPAGGRDELGGLGRAINAMLDSIDAGQRAIERERASVADAALETARNPFDVPRQHEPRDPHAAERGAWAWRSCCWTMPLAA